jgi:hypothetical protein
VALESGAKVVVAGLLRAATVTVAGAVTVTGSLEARFCALVFSR